MEITVPKIIAIDDNHNVRMFEDTGLNWFCVSDICNCLNISNKPSRVSHNVEDSRKKNVTIKTDTGNRSMLFVDENSAYGLIYSSRSRNSKAMKELLFKFIKGNKPPKRPRAERKEPISSHDNESCLIPLDMKQNPELADKYIELEKYKFDSELQHKKSIDEMELQHKKSMDEMEARFKLEQINLDARVKLEKLKVDQARNITDRKLDYIREAQEIMKLGLEYGTHEEKQLINSSLQAFSKEARMLLNDIGHEIQVPVVPLLSSLTSSHRLAIT